jgi:putative ABC transport system permease protein
MTIAEALLISIMVSIIAGIYPAWRAAEMQPIDALRQL